MIEGPWFMIERLEEGEGKQRNRIVKRTGDLIRDVL
jgi:hypothetical protein